MVDRRRRPSRLHPASFRDLRCRTQPTGRPVRSFHTTTRARRRASSARPRSGPRRSSQYFTFLKNAFFIFDQRLPPQDTLCSGGAYQFAFYSIRCSYRYSPIGVKYGTLRIYELHDYVITRSLRFYAFTSVRALVLPVRGADVCWPALARPSEAGHSRPPIPSVRTFANPAGFAEVPATGSRSYTSLHPMVCPIPSPAAALANLWVLPRFCRGTGDR